MNKLILGIDIDGVLADFNNGFAERLRSITGRDLLPEDVTSPPTWNWPQHYGYTDPEVAATWEHCWKDDEFWRDLSALGRVDEFFDDIIYGNDIYFITARIGVDVKRQTEDWLEMYGFQSPTVLIAYDKGPLAKALKLTHFIDDRDKNCEEVADLSPQTQVFLLDRDYNRASQTMLKAMGITVAVNRDQFVEAIHGNHK
jgi:5'(3')-deoxyribonucleotidase